MEYNLYVSIMLNTINHVSEHNVEYNLYVSIMWNIIYM